MQDIVQRYMMLSISYQLSKIFGIAKEWTVRESNPSTNEFLAPVQTGPGAHQSSYTLRTRTSFRGVALTTHRHLVPMLKEE